MIPPAQQSPSGWQPREAIAEERFWKKRPDGIALKKTTTKKGIHTETQTVGSANRKSSGNEEDSLDHLIYIHGEAGAASTSMGSVGGFGGFGVHLSPHFVPTRKS
jgi:hypothetical protein